MDSGGHASRGEGAASGYGAGKDDRTRIESTGRQEGHSGVHGIHMTSGNSVASSCILLDRRVDE